MEEVVEEKRSLVVQRVGLCGWILFKLYDIAVGQSSRRVGPRGRIRWAIISPFRPLIAHQGLVLIIGKDTHWHWLLARRCFRERVCHFVEAPWDVIELKAIESVL